MNKTHRRDARTRRRWFRLIAAGVLAAWAVAGLRYITFAEGDEPRSVDAVYVLGPATQARLEVGLELIESGYSSELVVTVSGNDELQEFCQQQHKYVLHCVTPDPITTGGEAAALAELADRHQWQSGMIVTMRSHISRARLSFEECFAGNILMIDERYRGGLRYEAYRFFYESAAFVKHFFSPVCS